LKTFIVAEIGSNWEGSIVKAKKIIHECNKVGADAVKFQMWRAEDIYSKDHPHWKEIKKSELTSKKIFILKKYADKEGIELFCSAFYPEAVQFLETINVKRYKVASRTCLFKDPHALETLKEKAKTKKPIIISMGMGGNKKIISRLFQKNKKLFCYCISEYPLKISKINWHDAIKFDGFSDHTIGITAAILFTTLKKIKKFKIYLPRKTCKA